jgi:DtxR family Mn-dependent transcriptional regulator
MSSDRIDEYLETIYKLEQQQHPVKVVIISSSLKLSPPTVHEMLQRLKGKGLINFDKGAVCLTRKGQNHAKKVIRKHRLSERFLTDVLGMGWDEAHDEACKLEHVISDKVEENLDKMLGQPETCPHGHPIPDKKGKIKVQKTQKLDSLKSGEVAVIKCVNEEEPKMLQYLFSLGLLPEVKIKIMEVAPFGGPFIIKVGKSRYALGRSITSKIEVHQNK